jgi:hypothetical protein
MTQNIGARNGRLRQRRSTGERFVKVCRGIEPTMVRHFFDAFGNT